jgi:hypothetical protein
MGSLSPSQLADMMPFVFSSIVEARRFMDHLAYVYVAENCDHPNFAPSDNDIRPGVGSQWTSILFRWGQAFERFIHQNSTLSTPDHREIQILQLRYTHYSISLDVSASDGASEMIWDNYLSRYKRIVSLADLICSNPGSNQSQSVFSVGRSLVAPLYDAARRCRDPYLRRRAVRILHEHPQREGMWDGRVVALVAERCVSLEEEGLDSISSAADIPEWKRLSGVTPITKGEQKLWCLSYNRRRGVGDQTIIQVEESLDLR